MHATSWTVQPIKPIVVMAIGLFPFVTAGSAIAAAPKDSGWSIKQNHRIYGDLDVYVSKSGVKVVCKDAGNVFTCAAPAWDFVLYSDARKLVAPRRSLKDWSTKGIRTALSLMSNDGLQDWPKTLVTENKKVSGIKCSLYAFPFRYENGRPASLKYGKFGEYSLTKELHTPIQAEKFLQALYDLPPGEGLPMRFTKVGKSSSFGFGLKYNLQEEHFVFLDTLSVKPLSQSIVFLPPALKAYKNTPESEIVVRREHMDDVFSTMMGERKPEKAVPKSK